MGKGSELVKKKSDLKILVTEDETVYRSLFVDLLKEEGFERISECTNGRDAYSLLKQEPFDLILTDLGLPNMRGEELVKHALEEQPDLTVLVVSGQTTVDGAVTLIKNGVFDFLSKPFNLEDFKIMVRRAVTHVAYVARTALQPILASLLNALERKDYYLKGHSERVAELASLLAKLAGLSPSTVKMIKQMSVVHDVGKLGVSEHILNKQGPLTSEEWEHMRQHPVYSAEILEPIEELKDGIPFVLHHHERFDGNGYPEGIAGEAIPREARIISVADAFDAMNSDRAYRKSLPREEIVKRLQDARGLQLDPGFTDLFLDNIADMFEVEKSVL